MSKAEKLYDEMGIFSVETFIGSDSVGHLLKLKEETDEAIESPTDIEEYSDCLLCLFAACSKAGFTFEEVIDSSFDKLKELRLRTWIKRDDDLYQHVKSI
jgi:hypothetical protein